jgi:hypothetical protein
MKILLSLAAGIALLAAAGVTGSTSHAAQNQVYAFGVTSQNPGCTEDGPPFCLSSPFRSGYWRSCTATAMPGA